MRTLVVDMQALRLRRVCRGRGGQNRINPEGAPGSLSPPPTRAARAQGGPSKHVRWAGGCRRIFYKGYIPIPSAGDGHGMSCPVSVAPAAAASWGLTGNPSPTPTSSRLCTAAGASTPCAVVDSSMRDSDLWGACISNGEGLLLRLLLLIAAPAA